MSLLTVLTYPDKRLKTVAKPVEKIDDSIRQTVNDMFETMYHDGGCGLAATQVNIDKRIIVVDLSRDSTAPQCFINLEISQKEGSITHEEGCLSVPGHFIKVTRATKIHYTALDQQGKKLEADEDSFLAICLQHELEHLDGILMIDKLSSLKRKRFEKKWEKQQREVL